MQYVIFKAHTNISRLKSAADIKIVLNPQNESLNYYNHYNWNLD